MLSAGDRAPDFSLPAHDGRIVSLRDFRGRRILLWFYPQAGTPGCTAEACGFRDSQPYYDENQIQILGISFDSVEDNAAFADANHFKFPLLSDLTHEVALAYGACETLHAQYADRISYLIDEQGVIARAYGRVDPRDHPARALAELLDE